MRTRATPARSVMSKVGTWTLTSGSVEPDGSSFGPPNAGRANAAASRWVPIVSWRTKAAFAPTSRSATRSGNGSSIFDGGWRDRRRGPERRWESPSPVSRPRGRLEEVSDLGRRHLGQPWLEVRWQAPRVLSLEQASFLQDDGCPISLAPRAAACVLKHVVNRR